MSNSLRPHELQLPGFPVLHYLGSWLKLMSIVSMMPSNHLVLSHPLLIMPSIYLRFKVFSNESALPIRWPKYWSFSFSISSSNEYSGLISFRTDWFDPLAVQGILKSQTYILSLSEFLPIQVATVHLVQFSVLYTACSISYIATSFFCIF